MPCRRHAISPHALRLRRHAPCYADYYYAMLEIYIHAMMMPLFAAMLIIAAARHAFYDDATPHYFASFH